MSHSKDTKEVLDTYINISGKTPQEVAKLLGVSRGAVTFWTNGDRQVPSWVVKVILLTYKNKITLEEWRDIW